MNLNRFHRFSKEELNGMELPKQFTFPFFYTPHPLCRLAANRLQEYLKTQTHWYEELQKGKMMGVLIVSRHTANTNDETEIGFLAAFSGNLAHSNNLPYFVPAIYNLLDENGFFRIEEENISKINYLIKQELQSSERNEIISRIKTIKAEAETEISQYKEFMKVAKAKRDTLRNLNADRNALITESQFQKAELKRIQVRRKQEIDSVMALLSSRDEQVKAWKAERQARSIALQEKIFRHFTMLNARGESSDLCEIFASATHGMPPAGAGECAAPKLLQYAYSNDYTPLAMAEFWVGESPKDIIRRHGHFYPACKTKCEPILKWMLQGLDVEPNPLETVHQNNTFEIIYEDEWILAVNKPAGMLSVPGKTSNKSLQELVEKTYPQENKPLIIHRLDMATSGVVLFAKSPIIHTIMQSLFENRNIEKQYIAILNGEVPHKEGIVSLPLTLNPQERPLQMVDYTHGKESITHFTVQDRKNNRTRITFYPKTGRTHQLRVHSSHPDGLNAPIVGDTLYGTHDDRLYLHAQSVTFTHPITGKLLQITAPCPF